MRADTEQLVEGLERISPMPPDGSPALTVERLQAYQDLVDQVSLLIRQSSVPEPVLIRPLISSFGLGDAFGLYWGTLHALEKYPLQQLRPALYEAIRGGAPGARGWSAYMLGRQRDRQDVALLISLLNDPEPEVRCRAVEALEMVGDASARPFVEPLLNDPVAQVREAVEEWLASLG